MRRFGYSTGALAIGDFRRALEMLENAHVKVVELSALRLAELGVLCRFVREHPHALDSFTSVSVHAPSRFREDQEAEVVECLSEFTRHGWPVVAHPDAIYNARVWEPLAHLLLIENMDKRKSVGRSAQELASIFKSLPRAGLCFDLAHARQFDTSLVEAYRILRDLGTRIRQVHISEVHTSSRHARMTPMAVDSYRMLAPLIPSDAPVIVEAPAVEREIEEQLNLAQSALTDGAARPALRQN